MPHAMDLSLARPHNQACVFPCIKLDDISSPLQRLFVGALLLPHLGG